MKRRLSAASVLAVAATAAGLLFTSWASGATCVPRGTWATPSAAGPQPLEQPELLRRLARRQVVLLGETHDDAEHHRWQLQMIAALHALRPDMVLGFEMFPRRVQPALERWTAGELTEAEFVRATDWRRVWNMEPQLYMPLFHLARMNRIPMLALNVERELTRAVREKGLDAVPSADREGVGQPAAASAAYLDFLFEIYSGHEKEEEKAARGESKAPSRADPGFGRFVATQLVWPLSVQGYSIRAHRSGVPLALPQVPTARSSHRSGSRSA